MSNKINALIRGTEGIIFIYLFSILVPESAKAQNTLQF